MGASVSLVSLLVGVIHVFVAIPDPVELRKGQADSKRKLLLHYGGAAIALFGGTFLPLSDSSP